MTMHTIQRPRLLVAALSCLGLASSLQGAASLLDPRITGTSSQVYSGVFTVRSGAEFATEPGAIVALGDPLSLANGGLGVALSDPNADRIPFWDDSAGSVAWLTVGSGLSISGTTLASAFVNPMSSSGDLIKGGTAGAPARLGIGTDGQVLTVVSGAPAWADATGGGGGGAPTSATYIVQTADGTLSNEQALGALASGLVKNTTTTGVLSIASAGTDYVAPGAASTSGLTMNTSRILGRTTASAGTVEELTAGAGLALSGGALSTSGALTSSGFTMATARLVGRTTASTGAPEEITVGSGLALSGGELSTSGALTSSGYTMSTARLIGRTTASTGAPEEITVGSGLALSGGTLTASGGTGDVVGPASATANALARYDSTTGKLVKNSNVTLADSGTELVFSGAGGLSTGTSGGLTFNLNATGAQTSAKFKTFGGYPCWVELDTTDSSGSGAATALLFRRAGTLHAFFSVAGFTDSQIDGSTVGDMAFRSATSDDILFSTDNGSSIGAKIEASTGALVAAKTTASTSTTTGALRSAGGLGVAGRTSTSTLNVGGTNGTTTDLLASASATLDFPSITASGGVQELTITVAGASTGDVVMLGLPATVDAGVVFDARVTGTDTVTVRATNTSAGAIDPSSASYRVAVLSF